VYKTKLEPRVLFRDTSGSTIEGWAVLYASICGNGPFEGWESLEPKALRQRIKENTLSPTTPELAATRNLYAAFLIPPGKHVSNDVGLNFRGEDCGVDIGLMARKSWWGSHAKSMYRVKGVNYRVWYGFLYVPILMDSRETIRALSLVQAKSDHGEVRKGGESKPNKPKNTFAELTFEHKKRAWEKILLETAKALREERKSIGSDKIDDATASLVRVCVARRMARTWSLSREDVNKIVTLALVEKWKVPSHLSREFRIWTPPGYKVNAVVPLETKRSETERPEGSR
jgi:hypothetical protein